jgi:predicted amidophosphoribosyltransferase
MGAYWRADTDELTPLGELIGSAKESASEAALAGLCLQLAVFVRGLDLPADALVVPVPPAPGRDDHPVPALAAEVASAIGATVGNPVSRENRTARLRDTPPSQRRAVVEAAGYEVSGPVGGRAVVLVDDVVLTGTTIAHIASLLRDAGARSVVAIIAARTRRDGSG